MPFPDYIPPLVALIRAIEMMALAVVSTDPMQAVRLSLLAAEMRAGGAA